MTPASRLLRTLDRLTVPNPPLVLLITALLLAADRLYERIGDTLLGGVCDEAAHLLTGVLVMGLLAAKTSRRFAGGLLAGSVLIDFDHIPRLLGTDWLTEGTPRPYTHSLLSLAALALVAIAWRRNRELLIGMMVGLAIHFARDLSESHAGLSLLWPWTRTSQSLPHWSYLVTVGGVSLIAAVRALQRSLGSERLRKAEVLEI